MLHLEIEPRTVALATTGQSSDDLGHAIILTVKVKKNILPGNCWANGDVIMVDPIVSKATLQIIIIKIFLLIAILFYFINKAHQQFIYNTIIDLSITVWSCVNKSITGMHIVYRIDLYSDYDYDDKKIKWW